MWPWLFTWSSSPHICCSRSARLLVLYSRWNAPGSAGDRHTVIQVSPHLKKEKKINDAAWSCSPMCTSFQAPQIKSRLIDQTNKLPSNMQKRSDSSSCFFHSWSAWSVSSLHRETLSENSHKKGQKVKKSWVFLSHRRCNTFNTNLREPLTAPSFSTVSHFSISSLASSEYCGEK